MPSDGRGWWTTWPGRKRCRTRDCYNTMTCKRCSRCKFGARCSLKRLSSHDGNSRSIYEETPVEPGAGMRCPATPVFVKDARRLHPAQTTIRAHRRSASMDPAHTGTITGGRSRLPSSSQDAGRAIGHRRNATMDPSQGKSSVNYGPGCVC